MRLADAATTMPGSTVRKAFEVVTTPSALLTIAEKTVPSSPERSGAVEKTMFDPVPSGRPLRSQVIVSGTDPSASRLSCADSPWRADRFTGCWRMTGGPSAAWTEAPLQITAARHIVLRRSNPRRVKSGTTVFAIMFLVVLVFVVDANLAGAVAAFRSVSIAEEISRWSIHAGRLR